MKLSRGIRSRVKNPRNEDLNIFIRKKKNKKRNINYIFKSSIIKKITDGKLMKLIFTNANHVEKGLFS